jgi:transketolase
MPSHSDLANAIRFLSMDAVEAARSGHPGMPMGMADVATVLFTKFLKFDPARPDWHDRDRFVLSAGHGSMLIYSLLHLTGYEDVTLDQLRRFRQMGSNTAGHPEYGHTPGIETTTGPLGQGIATAVGMAMAERYLQAGYGRKLVDHRTYVIASDGDLMEGISHEAISLAGVQKLSKLIVLWDDNSISIDGDIRLSETGDQLKRFQAAGWQTQRIDGHDPAAIEAALAAAVKSGKPSLIACRTRIGFGAPTLEGTAKTHGSPLGATEIAGAREKLGWPHAPFEIPADILSAWRQAGSRGAGARSAWEERLASLAPAKQAAFEVAATGTVDATRVRKAVAKHAAALAGTRPALATREASGAALEVLVPLLPAMVGGSADLTGSNNTRTKGMVAFAPKTPKGRYVHYGVREHGMAAAMNGMALHGGVIPYSGTFLVFADYLRPALRLAALMGVRAIHVLTHDSIGLGEDGPTHQPVEHLASLRAIPNLNVFRPCDAVEAAECWEIALSTARTPSVMALSRQKLAFMREDGSRQNRSAAGAYVLRAAPRGMAETVCLLASGSEVEIAAAAQAGLAAAGIGARLVSVPCLDLFEAQDAAAQAAVLGPASVRIAVEAGVRQGWDRLLGASGQFVGMSSFGASAPYQQLYTHFGITSDAVVQKATAALGAGA